MGRFLIDGGDMQIKLPSGSNIYISNDFGKVNTTVSVDENSVIRTIPDNFLGLTLYMGSFNTFIPLAQNTQIPYNLLNNLGKGTLRIQGDGENDWGTTVTTDMVDAMIPIITSIGWDFTWMVNLRDNDTSLSSAEAYYVYSKLGSKLLGIEIGNEPDYYAQNSVRALNYDISAYMTEWLAHRSAILALNSSIPITSPSSGTSNWLLDFVTNEGASYVDTLNIHYYPANAQSIGDLAQPTIVNLLSKGLAAQCENFLTTCETIQSSANKHLVLGETNSISHQGKNGVSNTFAQSLWALDYAFRCLKHNLYRINFQCAFLDTTSFFYNPIAADGTPLPLYYGLLAFHLAAPNGNMITTSIDSNVNVTSYATIGSDNKLRVTLINKDLNKNAYVKLIVSNTYTTATAVYLKAPTVNATSNILLGGSAVKSDGTFEPILTKTLSILDKVVNVPVSKYSAAIITFE